MNRRAVAVSVTWVVWLAAPAAGQDGAPSTEPVVEARLANLTRVETWRFFEPLSPDVNPDYTFFANRSDLDVDVRTTRFDLSAGFSYVRVQSLPTDAIGPGGLGTGAFYYAASGLPYSYQLFLTGLTLSAHTVDRRRTLSIGRMPHTSGAEGERAATDPSLAAVRRLAIDGRLIGTFDWSYYQRRFDGARVDWRGDRGYSGGGAFFVTQGGYEESANLTMSKLQVGTAYAGRIHRGDSGTAVAVAESQLFGVVYRDRRAIAIRPDNAGVDGDAVDITVTAAGGSHVASRSLGRGRVDYAVWGAGQFGDWYGQSHRAYAVAVQGGYRWAAAPGRPWLRGGWSFASGDPDGRDDRHETFFPMLQETRSYAQSMVYAHANLRDVFAQIHAEPHARLRVRADLHGLALAESADRWYQGSGATARDGTFFGFSSRRSGNAHGLGTVAEAAADLQLSKYWSVNAYAGRMWGGAVVGSNFAGDRLFYWYVENVLQLVVPRPSATARP